MDGVDTSSSQCRPASTTAHYTKAKIETFCTPLTLLLFIIFTMYTYIILSILLVGRALAAPNPIGMSPQPHFRHIAQPVPVKRDTPFSSVAYGVLPQAGTATTTITVFTTVTATSTTVASTLTPSSTSISTPTTTTSPEPTPVTEQAGVSSVALPLELHMPCPPV